MASQDIDLTPPKSASVAKVQQAPLLDYPSRVTRYQLRRMSAVGALTSDATASETQRTTQRSTRSRHSVAGGASEDSDTASIWSEPGGGGVATRRATRASSQQPRTPPKVEVKRTRRNSTSCAGPSASLRTTRSRPKLSPMPSEEVSPVKSSSKNLLSVSPTKRDSFGSPRRLFTGEKASADTSPKPSSVVDDVVVPLSEPKRLSLRSTYSPRGLKTARLSMKNIEKKLDMLSKDQEKQTEQTTSSDKALTPKSNRTPDVDKVDDSPKTPGSIEDITPKTPESGALKSPRLSGSEESVPLSPVPSVKSPTSRSRSRTPREQREDVVATESDKSEFNTPQTRSKTPLSDSSKKSTPQALNQTPKSESNKKAPTPQRELSTPQTPLSDSGKKATPQALSQTSQSDSSKKTSQSTPLTRSRTPQNDSNRETPQGTPLTRSQTPLLSDSDKQATSQALSQTPQNDCSEETPQGTPLTRSQTLLLSDSDKQATPQALSQTPQNDCSEETPQGTPLTRSRTSRLSESDKKAAPQDPCNTPQSDSSRETPQTELNTPQTPLSDSAKKVTPLAPGATPQSDSSKETPQRELSKKTPQGTPQTSCQTPLGSDSDKKATALNETPKSDSSKKTPQTLSETPQSGSPISQVQQQNDASISVQSTSESGKKIALRVSSGGRNVTPRSKVTTPQRNVEEKIATPESRSVTPQSGARQTGQTPEKPRTRSSASESESSPRSSIRHSQSRTQSESAADFSDGVFKSPAHSSVVEKEESSVLGGSPKLSSRLSLRRSCSKVDSVEETLSHEKLRLKSGDSSEGIFELEQKKSGGAAEEDKEGEKIGSPESSGGSEACDATEEVYAELEKLSENHDQSRASDEEFEEIVLKKIAITEETDEDSDGEAVIAEVQVIEEENDHGLETEDEIEEGKNGAVLEVRDSDEDSDGKGEDKADQEDEDKIDVKGDDDVEDEDGDEGKDKVSMESEDDVDLEGEGEEEEQGEDEAILESEDDVDPEGEGEEEEQGEDEAILESEDDVDAEGEGEEEEQGEEVILESEDDVEEGDEGEEEDDGDQEDIKDKNHKPGNEKNIGLDNRLSPKFCQKFPEFGKKSVDGFQRRRSIAGFFRTSPSLCVDPSPAAKDVAKEPFSDFSAEAISIEASDVLLSPSPKKQEQKLPVPSPSPKKQEQKLLVPSPSPKKQEQKFPVPSPSPKKQEQKFPVSSPSPKKQEQKLPVRLPSSKEGSVQDQELPAPSASPQKGPVSSNAPSKSRATEPSVNIPVEKKKSKKRRSRVEPDDAYDFGILGDIKEANVSINQRPSYHVRDKPPAPVKESKPKRKPAFVVRKLVPNQTTVKRTLVSQTVKSSSGVWEVRKLEHEEEKRPAGGSQSEYEVAREEKKEKKKQLHRTVDEQQAEDEVAPEEKKEKKKKQHRPVKAQPVEDEVAPEEKKEKKKHGPVNAQPAEDEVAPEEKGKKKQQHRPVDGQQAKDEVARGEKKEKKKKQHRTVDEQQAEDEVAPEEKRNKHRPSDGLRLEEEVTSKGQNENMKKKRKKKKRPLDGEAREDHYEKKTLDVEDISHKLTSSKKTEDRIRVPTVPSTSNFELGTIKQQEKSKSKRCLLDEASSLSVKKKDHVSVDESSSSRKRKAVSEDKELVNVESSKKLKVENKEGVMFLSDDADLDRKMRKKKKLEERLRKIIHQRKDFAAVENSDDDAPTAVSFSDSRQFALQEESKKEAFLAEKEKLVKEKKKLKRQRMAEQKAEKLKRKADCLEDFVEQPDSCNVKQSVPKGKKTYFGETQDEYRSPDEAGPSRKRRRSEESASSSLNLQKELEREKKRREKGLAVLLKRHKMMSSSFIPLEAPSGATRFGVVPLKNSNNGGNLIGEAAAFRSKMLYGNRVNRVSNNVLQSQNEKKKALNSFSTSRHTHGE